MAKRSKVTKSVRRMPLRSIVNSADNSRRLPFRLTPELYEIVWHSLNRAVFHGVLKRPTKLIIMRSPNPKFWGECEGVQQGSRWGEHYTRAIRVQRDWPDFKKFVNVLAHEMVHQYEWEQQQTMSHGRETFLCWRPILKEKGLMLAVSM